MGDLRFDGQRRDGTMGLATSLTPHVAHVTFPAAASPNAATLWRPFS